MNTRPYVIRGDVGAYEIVDTRTDRVAHSFKHHPDAESCKDSMNEWVMQESSTKDPISGVPRTDFQSDASFCKTKPCLPESPCQHEHECYGSPQSDAAGEQK